MCGCGGKQHKAKPKEAEPVNLNQYPAPNQ